MPKRRLPMTGPPTRHAGAFAAARALPATVAGRCRTARWFVLLGCASFVLVAMRGTALAQDETVEAPVAAGESAAAEVDEETQAENFRQPFVLPAQPSEIAEALDDFKSGCRQANWEKAFQALDKVVQSPSSGLVPGEGGVMVPTSVLVRQLLLDLPASGKDAYRLFHDADAKALWEQARGGDEFAKLSQLVAAHLITSVGDVAADRLGDLYFEQGHLHRAVECWQAVLKHRPDSALPRVGLLVKSAVALARSGRWTEFQEVQREVQRKHAGETVELGGRKVSAVKHLASLAAARAASPAEKPADLPDDLQLPDSKQPLWQFPIFAKASMQPASENSVANDEDGNLSLDVPIPTVTDGALIYANVLGCHLALDLKDGKARWQIGDLGPLAQQIRNSQIAFPDRYNVVLDRGRLWFITADPNQASANGSFHLVCREAVSGKELLNTSQLPELQPWTMVGTPLPRGDRVYVAAMKTDAATELYVLSLSAKDGTLAWSTHVGSFRIDPSQMTYQRSALPVLAMRGDRLFVETHAGVLMALEAGDGSIDWGLVYDSEMINPNQYYNQPAELVTAGVPLLAEGRLYFKGMFSRRLMAVNLDAPSVEWKRPVSESALLLSIERQRFYLSGEDLTAYDLESRRLLWATKLPQGTGWIRPLVTRERIYQFTPRGIFEVDKSSGRVTRIFRGADLDSLGGSIVLTPQALVTVSNLAITAYPLKYANSAASATATAAPTVGDEPAH